MSVRSERVQRLVQLRERQHALTRLQLRSARLMLRVEEEALAHLVAQTHSLWQGMHAALASGASDEWMVGCAEQELLRLSADRHHAGKALAQRQVDTAAVDEAAARLQTKQMEHTYEKVRRAEAEAASYLEQAHLDEAARNLKAFSVLLQNPASGV